MKKLLLLFLLLPSLVIAADDTSSSNSFSLIITFSENVNIESYDLLDITGTSVTDFIVEESIPSTVFNFTTQSAVPNGDYVFEVSYSNKNSGAGSSIFKKTHSITVASSEITNDFNIEIVSPALGYSSSPPPFPITIQTDEDATCRYSLFEKNPVFENNIQLPGDGFTHTLSYAWADPELILWVFCKSNTYSLRQAIKSFSIGYVTGSPQIIKMTQNPNPLKDGSFRDVVLTIDTIHESVCKLEYSGVTYPTNYSDVLLDINAYNKTNVFKVCFKNQCPEGLPLAGAADVTDTSPHVFPINVECTNRPLQRVSGAFPATMHLTNDANLQVLSPRAKENRTSFPIILRSDLALLSCTYDIDGTVGVMTNNSRHNWTAQSGSLTQGNHLLKINCNSYSGTRQKEFPFIIDTQPPTDFEFEIEGNICLGRDFVLNWSANDTTSGVQKLVYEIIEDGEVVSVRSINSVTSVSHSFDLNKSYSIKAYAVDFAGNPSTEINKDFEVHNESDVECDTEKPTVRVNQKPFSDKTDYWISCSDDDSGCSDEYFYDFFPGRNENAINCTYNLTAQIDENTTSTITGILCYEVSDLAGNTRNGKELIAVESDPAYCGNGLLDLEESDIDCGGSCKRCGLNKSCYDNADCESGFCNNGFCKEEEGCLFDSDCNFDEVCDTVTRSCKLIQKPGCTDDLSCAIGEACVEGSCVSIEPDGSQKNINWMSIIMLLFGVILLGGGGIYYFLPEATKPINKTSKEFKTKKPELEFKIKPAQKLDYNEEKKVRTLRKKLETSSSKKRKQLLGSFDSKVAVDKEKPAVAESEPVKLQKKDSPKIITKTKEKTKEKQKEEEEYIDLTKKNNKKSKDLFDELEEI